MEFVRVVLDKVRHFFHANHSHANDHLDMKIQASSDDSISNTEILDAYLVYRGVLSEKLFHLSYENSEHSLPYILRMFQNLESNDSMNGCTGHFTDEVISDIYMTHQDICKDDLYMIFYNNCCMKRGTCKERCYPTPPNSPTLDILCINKY